MLVQDCTNLVLVVRVLGDHSGEDLLTSHQVALLVRHLLLLLLLSHSCHLLLLLHHLNLLWRVATSHLAHAHVRVVAAHWRLLHVWRAAAVHLIVARAVVGADIVTLRCALIATRATRMTARHGALLLLHEVGHGLE